MIAVPSASNHHIIHQSFSFQKEEIQQGTFSGWFTHQLHQEVVSHTFQESLGLVLLCCVIFPADVWEVEVSHKNKGK